MKNKQITISLLFLLLISFSAAQEYPFDASVYSAKELTVELESSGSIVLSGSGSAQKLEATVHYVPEEAISIQSDPAPQTTNPLVFVWRDSSEGNYDFKYTTRVQSTIQRPLITQNIPYPFVSPETVTSYLSTQEITDTNSQIRALSRKLAANTKDSTEAVFAIATWVGENVRYDLNTVTIQASKPSSWVLTNKQGVCDELTSLFISLSREAGIPARFVSGYAYTNLPEFPDHWGPHGWAEVWLPEIGWVPVDVTYGQIGYVDATHIPIRHSLDAKNTAVEYEMLANGLSMQPSELKTKARIIEKKGVSSEPLVATLTAVYQKTGSESGNLIRATIRNNAKYYIATETYLTTTKDTVVHDNRRQNILLPPGATRTVSWRVTMPEYDEGYRYTIPFSAFTQRAENASTTVEGAKEYQVYPELEEETTQQASLEINCESAPPLYVGEKTTVLCASDGARLCANTCSPNELRIQFEATKPGAYPITVKANKGEETGNAIVTFVVEQPPQPSISMNLPASAGFDDTIAFTFTINTNTLTDSTVVASTDRFSHEWKLDKLDAKQFELRFPATYLDAGENTVKVIVKGKDKNGDVVETTASTTINLDVTFGQKIRLFFMHLFG